MFQSLYKLSLVLIGALNLFACTANNSAQERVGLDCATVMNERFDDTQGRYQGNPGQYAKSDHHPPSPRYNPIKK